MSLLLPRPRFLVASERRALTSATPRLQLRALLHLRASLSDSPEDLVPGIEVAHKLAIDLSKDVYQRVPVSSLVRAWIFEDEG